MNAAQCANIAGRSKASFDETQKIRHLASLLRSELESTGQLKTIKAQLVATASGICLRNQTTKLAIPKHEIVQPAISIIAEFLSNYGLAHTLNTLIAETGIAKAEILTRRQIIKQVQVQSDSTSSSKSVIEVLLSTGSKGNLVPPSQEQRHRGLKPEHERLLPLVNRHHSSEHSVDFSARSSKNPNEVAKDEGFSRGQGYINSPAVMPTLFNPFNSIDQPVHTQENTRKADVTKNEGIPGGQEDPVSPAYSILSTDDYSLSSTSNAPNFDFRGLEHLTHEQVERFVSESKFHLRQ